MLRFKARIAPERIDAGKRTQRKERTEKYASDRGFHHYRDGLLNKRFYFLTERLYMRILKQRSGNIDRGYPLRYP